MWIPLCPKSKYKVVKDYKLLKDLAMALAPSSLILFLEAENPPKLTCKLVRPVNYSKAAPIAFAPFSLMVLYYNSKVKEVKVFN